VVNGAAHPLGTETAIEAVVALGICFSLWWIYFDNIAEMNPPKPAQVGRITVFIYCNAPLWAGLAGFAAAVLNIVGEAHASASAVRWLLCGSYALVIISFRWLEWTGSSRQNVVPRVRALVRWAGAVGAIGIGLAGPTLPISLAGLLILSLVQVVVSIFEEAKAHGDPADVPAA
jgi:low temperature requirement protein LtrA